MIFLFHKFAGLLFALFILFDRFYIRRRLEQDKREELYKKSKKPLAFLALLMIFTGGVLLFNYPLTPLIIAKSLLGVILIVMFFSCPYAMAKMECDACKSRYRSIVTFVLLFVLLLGVLI